MSAITRQSDQSVASELLGRLAAGIAPETMDGFIDDAVALAGDLKYVRFGFVEDSSVRLESRNGILCEARMPRAKTKLRMVCARLAARCSAWSNRQVSPYGDMVEFNGSGHQQIFKVSFENSPDDQWFAVQANPAG